MSDYRLNKKVSLSLPWDYGFSKSFDDDGNEIYSIFKGCTVDDEGEEFYEFKCTIRETIIEKNAATEGKTLRELWVNAFEKQENVKYLILPGKPDTLMLTLGTGINIFGRVLKLVSLTTMVTVDENSFLTLISSKGYNEENPDDYLPVVESMLTVVRSIVINGKGHAQEPVTAASVLEALKPSFDGSAPAEVSIGLNVTVDTGDETVTYGYSDRASSTEQLMRMQPDESLYPHYLSIKNNPASLLGTMGAKVVINGTGTEYEFKSLQKELTAAASDPDSDLSEKYSALYQRIVDADHSEYNLDERAKEMLPLFRVDPSVFDTKHDRECELAEGYMHRAYMMSALRSFAWTLSDWCRNKNIQPEDLLYGDLQYIISHISIHEWLNYDADTYCVGLCGCQDLHVYYVPDGVSYSDRQALLPDAEHLAQIEAIRKQFPGFKEIPTQVHSLDALREDLSYILPAIETIYDALAEERNRMEPLSSDAADILYAWCALALAAKGPFFTEDGPINCWYTQKRDDALSAEMDKQSKKNNNPRAKRVASDDCTISFSGILEKYKGEDAAIVLPEGINAIGSDAFLFNKTLKTVIISDEVETIEADAFWGCEALEEVAFPTSLRTICKNAFRSCESLRTIIIPEGVREIEEDAFTGCTNLKDIYLPASLWSIGNDAFCTFNNETVIHAPKGSDAAQYARKHDLKLDHKKPSAAKTKSYNRKSAAVKKTPVKLPEYEIRFAEANRVILENGLAVPVPDGYHCCSEGTGVNAGWAYVIPEGISFDSNHIDTKPYSFAVTVSSGAHITFESKYMEALKKAFLSKGYLAAETPVESLIVSENCGFLYQNWIDDGDATYNKINGFLFAGEDVFQFHIYANHCSGIAHDQKVMDAFLKACREWMQRIRLSAEIIPTKNTVKTTTSKPMDPRQLTPEECSIDENGVFQGYYGSKTDIILPNTISAIGQFCFFSDTVKSVAIPYGITAITDRAFMGCTSLTNITIPGSVTAIGNSAFEDCTGLTNITIPDSVTSIGKNAFHTCTGLTDIAIPESVVSIGEGAFWECIGLTGITIPASVTSIGDYAFSDCATLTSITISSHATSMGSGVFSGCCGITHITIADFVELDSGTFLHCDSIATLTFVEGSKTVPGWVSNLSDSLTSVVLPDSVTTIAEEAFRNCTHLKEVTIPDGVTTIGKSAFCGCSGLESITIPNQVTTIGDYAFQNCAGLQTLTVSDSVREMGWRVFEGCSSITKIIIAPGSQKVPSWMPSCENLKEFIIPDGVIHIEEEALYENTMLENIELPNSITTIGESAFSGCSSLQSIRFPDHLTSIESFAFSKCAGLTEITIPESVASIGSYAFEDCAGLTTVTLSGNIGEFSSFVFEGCNNVTKVILTPGSQKVPYGLTAFKESLTEVIIPVGVTHVDQEAFYECARLIHCILPDSLLTIGDLAFAECAALESISLPEGLMSIGESAFDGCSNLKTVTVPDSVTEIGSDAFDAGTTIICSEDSYAHDFAEKHQHPYMLLGSDGTLSPGDAAESHTQRGSGSDERNTSVPEQAGPVQLGDEVCDTDENGTFIEYHGPATAVILPSCIESINGFDAPGIKKVIIPGNVKSIDEGAFFVCKQLEEVIIQEGLLSIGETAFSECVNLKHIVLPKTLQTIGRFAFSHCEALTSITIPDGVTTLSDYIFCDCAALSDVDIPDSITTIGKNAFSNCTSLTSIVIPESVSAIGPSAFSGCAALTDIELPEGITEIQESVFFNCSNLKTLVLPENTTTIGDSAFWCCKELTEVIIPNGVAVIGEKAFYGCEGLTRMALPRTVTTIGEKAFARCDHLKEIRLPANFKGIIEKEMFSFHKGLETIVLPVGISAIKEAAFQFCEQLKDIHLPPFIKEIHDWAFMGISNEATFHVVKGSYPERFCQEKGYQYDYNLDPELLKILQAIVRARKAQAEAKQRVEEEQKLQERCERYQKFVKAIEMQKQIITQNKGLFGSQAQARKEAQEKLARLQAQMEKEFPNGKP